MKSFLLFLLVCSALAASGQKNAVKPQPALVKLNNATDSIQYFLGAYVGLFIQNNGFSSTTASPLFIKGMEDILQNRARPFPDSVIATNLERFQQSLQKGKAAQDEQQLFATLKDKPNVGMFPNGVRYIILQAGKGARPSSPNDSLSLQMIAKLPDGTVVEDTHISQPFEATALSFFPGLEDALQMMNEGSKWQVFVPASLAYGEKGTQKIPPGSALVIEIEMLRVRRK